MRDEWTWRIGGQQGEKTDSAELILAAGLCRQGYYLYGYREFSSRIMGGSTSNTLRIGTKQVGAVAEAVDMLIAYDREALDGAAHLLREGSIVLMDAKRPFAVAQPCPWRLVELPMTEIAERTGGVMYKSMVAVGATAAFLGLPIKPFHDAAEKEWGRKGGDIVSRNLEALSNGYAAAQSEMGSACGSPLRSTEAESGPSKLLMIGNEAIGLGAIAAGCRFMAAYPITPATEIMEYLTPRLPQFGGVVIQTEDEIAAATMAIGAGYAGVRACTATSGPGFALMTEAIGLAGMTETPVVIVDTQRGGPSTGMPTKLEQSDVNAAIYGTHGETPKIVLAPSTVEDCFYDTVEAFNLAESMQCPVIVLTDLQLSLGKMTAPAPDYRRLALDRGRLAPPQAAPAAEPYRRFAMTPDGVSPRALPGSPGMLHHVTGAEHDEAGRASEDAANRAAMMAKRLRKLQHAWAAEPVRIEGDPDGTGPLDVLLVAMGSAAGAAAEAAQRLRARGVVAEALTVRQLHPFPAAAVQAHAARARRVLVAEHNATGQLAALLRLRAGIGGVDGDERLCALRRFDGTAFTAGEIAAACEALLP